jgi:hypothetical protein
VNGNNLNVPPDMMSLGHGPVAAPLNHDVLNTNGTANTNTLYHGAVAPVAMSSSVNNIDTMNPGDDKQQNIRTTAKTSRKRKSDNGNLILPEGSRRIRKKKICPEGFESIPASTKRAKKKDSGRK